MFLRPPHYVALGVLEFITVGQDDLELTDFCLPLPLEHRYKRVVLPHPMPVEFSFSF